MSGDPNRLDAATKQALAKGCVVVKPNDHQLFIDIDSNEDLVIFCERIPKVLEARPGTWTHAASPSGKPGHFHVTVNFRDPNESEWERIALQAVLGSDRTREYLSSLRVLKKYEYPTLFFEKSEGGF